MSDVSEVLTLLADIANKWEEIGMALKIQYTVLDQLTMGIYDNLTRLAMITQSWIETKSTPVTWETMISVVEGPIVNSKTVADKIRKFMEKPKVTHDIEKPGKQ